MKNSQAQYQAFTVPISVKGIVFEDDSVWLRQSDIAQLQMPHFYKEAIIHAQKKSKA